MAKPNGSILSLCSLKNINEFINKLNYESLTLFLTRFHRDQPMAWHLSKNSPSDFKFRCEKRRPRRPRSREPQFIASFEQSIKKRSRWFDQDLLGLLRENDLWWTWIIHSLMYMKEYCPKVEDWLRRRISKMAHHPRRWKNIIASDMPSTPSTKNEISEPALINLSHLNSWSTLNTIRYLISVALVEFEPD